MTNPTIRHVHQHPTLRACPLCLDDLVVQIHGRRLVYRCRTCSGVEIVLRRGSTQNVAR